MILKPGDCIRLFAGTKDNRPGVVLQVTEAGLAVVAIGTSTDRSYLEPEPVVIECPSWEAEQMGLDVKTWFTGATTAVKPEASDAVVQKYKGRCPPDVFLRLERLVFGPR